MQMMNRARSARRLVLVSLLATTAVLVGAGAAQAFTISASPNPARPGDTVTISVIASDGCNFNDEGADNPVVISSPAGILVVEQYVFDRRLITHEVQVPNDRSSVGTWTYFFPTLVETCADGSTRPVGGGTFEVTLGEEPDPLVAPVPLAVMGVTAAALALGVGTHARRRRAA
jgi:hypothetical protein